MKEKWKIDQYGFVHSPRNFFHINDVKYFIKKDATNIIIGFQGNGIDLDMKEENQRDKIFMWFQKVKIATAKAEKKHHEWHHNLAEAQLATQKRIISAHIEGVK